MRKIILFFSMVPVHCPTALLEVHVTISPLFLWPQPTDDYLDRDRIFTQVMFRGGREIARQSGAMVAGDIVRWARSHA